MNERDDAMPAAEAPARDAVSAGGRAGGELIADPSEEFPSPVTQAVARDTEAGEPAATWARTAVREPAATANPDQLSDDARRWTEQLLGAMGFEARVTAHAEGDRVDVMAEVGADEELLTGAKGEVRQALQHLLNRMVNRGDSSRYHLQLEINDFWQRRERELEDVARSMADDAVARGDEVVSEYLNAQERRIIHVTLRGDTRVRTYALGTGMIKRIAVAPADFRGGPQDDV